MARAVDPRFAQRMRELLEQRSMSYRAFARRVYYSPSYIHYLATGERPPTVEAAQRIDAALDAGGELAALVHADPVHSACGQGGDDVRTGGHTGDMQRRMLLTGLAGVAGGQAVDRLGLSALIAGLADRQPDGRTVDDWHEAVWEYGHTYLTAPRAELLAELAADLATVGAVADGVTNPKALAGLNDAAANLAGLVAMVSTDLGYTREARHAWRLARRLADASGSLETRLWVSGQEAVLGLYCRRPLPTVLALADQGLANGRTRAAGVAHLHSARAQALARLDRRDEALAALDDVRIAFDQLPDTVTGRNDSIFNWPEHRLRHTESFVHSLVGQTADAYEAQDRALAMYSPAQTISRSQVQLHRAACMVRDGEVHSGIDHAAATLTSLPEFARGRFVLTVAGSVLASVADTDRGRPEVRDYEHVLAATGGRDA